MIPESASPSLPCEQLMMSAPCASGSAGQSVVPLPVSNPAAHSRMSG